MKSFVAYPSALQKVLFPQTAHAHTTGIGSPHIELFKKIQSLDGSVVKCGVSIAESFSRFSAFRQFEEPGSGRKMIAFEKHQPSNVLSAISQSALQANIEAKGVAVDNIRHSFMQKAAMEKIDFLPGNVDDAIPDYLIQNPELKIAYLEVDVDNYNAAMTCLEFFYPRLVSNGVLVLNNYYKKEEDFQATQDYFAHARILIHNFSVNNGPHYVVTD